MTAVKKKSTHSAGVLGQVAGKAGVSEGTVSRVFNNSSLIPKETRRKVLDAARELGFRPRIGVRNRKIALITEPPSKTVMGGYVNTLTQHICYALSREEAEITMITEDRIGNLSDCWLDGVIGIAWEDKTIDLLKKLEKIPVVWLSDNHADIFHCVYTDSEKTGRTAGAYLYAKGHRTIAVIHETDYVGQGRMRGFKLALTEQGVPDNSILDIPSETPPHLAVKQAIDFGCSAIWVTGEDMKVLEINWILQELAGKKIPGDISLLAFENPGISEFQRPSLTTIASPLREIAEKAVETVLAGLSGELKKIELPVRLIERNSVRDIHTKGA